jgi:hypothetical protein
MILDHHLDRLLSQTDVFHFLEVLKICKVTLHNDCVDDLLIDVHNTAQVKAQTIVTQLFQPPPRLRIMASQNPVSQNWAVVALSTSKV